MQTLGRSNSQCYSCQHRICPSIRRSAASISPSLDDSAISTPVQPAMARHSNLVSVAWLLFRDSCRWTWYTDHIILLRNLQFAGCTNCRLSCRYPCTPFSRTSRSYCQLSSMFRGARGLSFWDNPILDWALLYNQLQHCSDAVHLRTIAVPLGFGAIRPSFSGISNTLIN